ncbi:BnaC07g14930D [Brassica napus]|uniref:(rape) hypothetical protein n=1 Tax=Brassica napus TaxID=3708 RepID=A0A078I0S0_BRANA|nr:unnamed protein product [Brassica napus]CDY43426.1 BnaC07g14930D [Brassica napus]
MAEASGPGWGWIAYSSGVTAAILLSELSQVNVEDGTRIIKIYKEYMSKPCILDDFKFYETRQKMIRDKKIKQKKQASTYTMLKTLCCSSETRQKMSKRFVVPLIHFNLFYYVLFDKKICNFNKSYLIFFLRTLK